MVILIIADEVIIRMLMAIEYLAHTIQRQYPLVQRQFAATEHIVTAHIAEARVRITEE